MPFRSPPTNIGSNAFHFRSSNPRRPGNPLREHPFTRITKGPPGENRLRVNFAAEAEISCGPLIHLYAEAAFSFHGNVSPAESGSPELLTRRPRPMRRSRWSVPRPG